MNTSHFAQLLQQAVTEPGIVSKAFSAFHRFSIGNQILAFGQCAERGIPLGPLATFPRWKALGRSVRKGERAISLCMPITIRKTRDGEDGAFTLFTLKPRWFVLSQTDGPDLAADPIPSWDRDRALQALDVRLIPFDLINGNVQGYATGRAVALNPVAPDPYATLFHELAHIVLGHTGTTIPRSADSYSEHEVEAESVAMLCCAALQLPGIENARAYIQHWNASGQPIPERCAARIFKATDQILKAGAPTAAAETD